MLKRYYETPKAVIVLGKEYLSFKFSKNSNATFEDFLFEKARCSYEKYPFLWLYLNYKEQNNLQGIISLWEISKDKVEVREAAKEKFYGSIFESAVSLRNSKIAHEVLNYIDDQSQYLEFANTLLDVYFKTDNEKEKLSLVDKPHPYYLNYLYPMTEGLICDAKEDYEQAMEKFKLAIKKIPYELPDRNILDLRIRSIESSISRKS